MDEHSNHNYGVLSDIDIRIAMSDSRLFIHPFTEASLQPIGYNLTPAHFVLSTKKGVLEKIHKHAGITFVWISPHDTVLISTREYVYVDNSLAGTFHSKVKTVSDGYGHISTTLDPDWKGPLLISLNNPSSIRKKFIISINDKPISFVTLILYYLNTATKKNHDNPPFRTDVLEEYIIKQPRILRFRLFKKRYEQFTKVIEMAKQSAMLDDIYKEAYHYKEIDDIELLLRSLKNFFRQKDGAVYSELSEKLFNLRITNRLTRIFIDLLETLLNKYYNYLNSNPCNNTDEVEEEIERCILRCLKRAKIERIAIHWDNRYHELENEIKKYSTIYPAFSLVWSKGIKYIAYILFLGASVAGVLLLNGGPLFTTVLTVLAAIHSLVLTVFFKDRIKNR